MSKEPSHTSGFRLLIVAGEASADAHAARVLKKIKEVHPDIDAFGVGGKRLQEEGLRTLVDSQHLSVVGGTDWIDQFGEVLRGYRRIRKAIREDSPDAALLLDLPDFNLLLARQLKRRGIPVVYYISPQVWAWRQYRVRTIAKVVDRMLVVFPFEESFYRERGVAADFVGHPLVESFGARATFRPQEEVVRAPRIALLPGSRRSELRYHGELLKGVREKLLSRYPQAEFKVPVASTLNERDIVASLGLEPYEAVQDGARQVFEWADIALVASGTATLEAALVNVPFALFYKVSPFSWWAVKHLVKYRGFLGMPNLLSGREVIKEFLQDRAEQSPLVDEAIRLIEDAEYRASMVNSLKECRQVLGGEGASARVASEVNSVLRGGARTSVFEVAPA